MRLLMTLLSFGLLVHGQEIDEETRKNIQEIFPKPGSSDNSNNNNNNNNDFLKDLEEVTQANNESYTALEKCGEGNTRRTKRCVKYHECDGKTNTIVQTGVTDGFGIIDIRFGANQCDDYLDVCCKIPEGDVDNTDRSNGDNNPVTTNVLIDPTTVTPVSKPSFCGIRNPNGIDFKITGNTENEAEYGEFPWTVAILNYKAVSQNDNSPLICGGSLITPNVVLTGAHCVNRFKIYDLIVRAGEWDTQTDKERLPYQERSVKQVISHPDFNPGNLYNDFALLILTESINKADNVGTICLPPENTRINSKNCFVSGWGKNIFGQSGVRQAILKKIQLPTIERRKCQDALRTTRLGSKFELHSSFICAGGEQGKDACTGDGGSPLICPDPSNPQRYVQAGIVAWGIGCGTLNIPGVYANVAKFRPWIDQELRRLNIDDSPYTV